MSRRLPPREPRGFQQISRLPWIEHQMLRPGDWIVLKTGLCLPPTYNARAWKCSCELCGTVRRVKSLTCSIVTREQKVAVWRAHFACGRWVTVKQIARLATEEERREAR